MMEKIANFVIQSTINREKREREKKKDHKSPSVNNSTYYKINLQYIESTLQQIFAAKKNEQLLSSRVRFRIQDLIDNYNRDWKQVIFGGGDLEDSDGFKYKYVPKDSILSEENISQH